MREDYTDITFLLDDSGSMSGRTGDTIGGYNAFIKEQKEVPGFATMTLYQFATTSRKQYEAKNMKDVEDITDKTYIANGTSTALLDAIGIAITETGKRLKEMNEKDRPAKVIMVI